MHRHVSRLRPRSVFTVVFGFGCIALASAQGIAPTPNASGQFPGGTWTNFESSHVKPLALARLGRPAHPEHYLLVCNTADSHLEIYAIDVAPSLPVFVARVPVGLDPVSVFWHEEPIVDATEPVEPDDDEVDGGGEVADEIRGTIYTANMAGDSVSRIDFRNVAGVPTATHTTTVNVGDEPMDITWFANNGSPFLVVSLNSRGAVTGLDPVTLATLVPDPYLPVTGAATFIDAPGGSPITLDVTMSQPRTVDIVNTTHPISGASSPFFFVLASRGTHHDFPGVTGYANTFASTEAGIDMMWVDVGPAASVVSSRRMLGTKNFNMAFDASGACLVVSGDAANRAQKGKANVAGEATGFLRTLLHVIPVPANPAGAVLTRDLNRATTAGGGLGSPVAPSVSLSHCTDVAVFQSGSTYKVYLAAFNNDLVGVIGNLKSGGGAWNVAPNTWTRNTIALPGVAGRLSGPTSLVARNATGSPGDPGNVVYVLSRFRNQIDAINPATDAVVGSFSLARNPTPAHVNAGRKFLYGVKAGNGFNSCASCHFDGRLDGLRWDLSEDTSNAPFSLQMIAALEELLWIGQTTFQFSVPKGEFITQSLQGLVNFEVAEPFAQNTWFTNKPYHWDMDQANLSDFNGGGFQVLLGGPALTTQEMATFQATINAIHYPPNYEQAPDRKFRGTFGTANNEATGTLSMLGLKLYHSRPIGGSLEGDRSCVQCHALPEGGNNLGTESFPAVVNGVLDFTRPLPLESAPLRGLAQKEAMWINDPVAGAVRQLAVDVSTPIYAAFPTIIKPQCLHLDTPTSPFTGLFLPSNANNHIGTSDGINDFNSVFAGALPTVAELSAVNQFTREFDVGVAPGIGVTTTIVGIGATPAAIAAQLEEVRTVNCGLAATGTIGGVRRGFWFDPSPAGTAPNFGQFFDVVSGAAFTPAALLSAMGASDQLVFVSTPLGMDRRRASAAATPPMLTGSAPTSLHLESMVPNTAYENVPSIEKNWDPFHPTPSLRFVWSGSLGSVNQEPWDLKSLRLMQAGYLPSGVDKHHEPPRRFRVSGVNIRHGAVLKIHVPMTAPPTADVEIFTLPLYPTDKVDDDGDRIWETAVEADPLMCGVFALGGFWAQGIDLAGTTTSVLLRTVVDGINESTFNPATHFNPGVWNNYTIEVVNEDGTNASASNQQIVLEPAGFVH